MTNTIAFIILFMFCLVTAEHLNLPEGANCTADVGRKEYNGTCVHWRRCYTLIVDIEQKTYPPVCSYKGKDPIICCTSCKLVDDVSKAVVNPTGGIMWKNDQISWNQCVDYVKTLPYDCKRTHVGYLYKTESYATKDCLEVTPTQYGVDGGRPANRSEFPHMALLGYGRRKDEGGIKWVCGGTIISDWFILTAGHCLSSPDVGNVTYAALGILKRSDPEELWQRYRIRDAIPHPDYRPPSKYHDIALLKTFKRIDLNTNALPACLPPIHKAFEDEQAEATGWGKLGHMGELADNLQAVKLTKFSPSNCSGIYKKHRHMMQGYDHTTQMCYGDYAEVRDTCQGDSGGPLQITGALSWCQKTVIGVTSFGRDCGQVGQAGMYTRVINYVPWIEGIVWHEDVSLDNDIQLADRVFFEDDLIDSRSGADWVL